MVRAQMFLDLVGESFQTCHQAGFPPVFVEFEQQPRRAGEQFLQVLDCESILTASVTGNQDGEQTPVRADQFEGARVFPVVMPRHRLPASVELHFVQREQVPRNRRHAQSL